MKVVKYHKSSFERQVQESVLIQSNRSHWLLNSKSEFNRCAIPRLGMKMGDRDYEEKRDEIQEEEKREAVIEEKIRNLKKERNRKRNPRRPDKNQPVRKKSRLDEELTNDEDALPLIAGMEERIKMIEDKKIEEKKRKLKANGEKTTTQEDIRKYCRQSDDQPQNKRQRMIEEGKDEVNVENLQEEAPIPAKENENRQGSPQIPPQLRVEVVLEDREHQKTQKIQEKAKSDENLLNWQNIPPQTTTIRPDCQCDDLCEDEDDELQPEKLESDEKKLRKNPQENEPVPPQNVKCQETPPRLGLGLERGHQLRLGQNQKLSIGKCQETPHRLGLEPGLRLGLGHNLKLSTRRWLYGEKVKLKHPRQKMSWAN
jgi:hypothetical protein